MKPGSGQEPFVEAFENYVGALVRQSCNELAGKEPALEELRDAGRVLVEKSEGLDIAENAKKLVAIIDDISGYGTLTPASSLADHFVADGYSLGDVIGAFREFENYFDTQGLALYAGYYDFNDRAILDLCLGETLDFSMPNAPGLRVFTNVMVGNTSDKIMNAATGSGDFVTKGWTDGKKAYSHIKPLQKEGEQIWSRLGNNAKAGPDDALERLEKLAWNHLFEESAGDMERFKKEYARTWVADMPLHEFFHIELGAEDDVAGLYVLLRGKATFEHLRTLYRWERIPDRHYAKAAESAFRYLRRAGYTEELWKNVEPGSPKAAETERSMRKLAGDALKLLEKEKGLPGHETLENRPDFCENYRQLVEHLKTALP